MKLNKLYVFLFMTAICISCSKTPKNDIKNEIDLNMEFEIKENYKKNVIEYSIKENNITDFFFNEIMNGNKDLSFRDGENGIVECFGNPNEIIVQPTSFYFEGGTVIELHEFVYDDFIHYYYVFENGKNYIMVLLLRKNWKD
jgi:hypothetical protein